MSLQLPSKEDCYYVIDMLEAGLIDFTYTQPWAEELIAGMDAPPSWLCEVAISKYQGDQLRAFRDYAYSEPFVSGESENEKFVVACLWLRYERRELSWATFLRMAGERLDSASADWECETPYHYLNVYEDAYFTKAAEESTKQAYLGDHDLRPWIERARVRFEPFRNRRRDNKSLVPTTTSGVVASLSPASGAD